MQQLLRDPAIQNTRLMPEESQQWMGQGEGSQEGAESENPLVGVTITKADKVQPIKVSTSLDSIQGILVESELSVFCTEFRENRIAIDVCNSVLMQRGMSKIDIKCPGNPYLPCVHCILSFTCSTQNHDF